MKYGILQNGQQVDLAEYIAIANQNSGKVKVFCPCCNAPVHPNRSLAAEGFTVSRKEVTSRISSQKRKPVPGFSHYRFGAKKGCKNNFANDTAFQGRPADPEYFAKIRARNQAAFDDPKMKKAIGFIQEYLMQRLTGSPSLSADDQNQLDGLANRLMETPGLHEHPWLLPYMQVLLVGNRERTFRSGWVAEAAYRSEGEQRLEFTDIDGEKRTMTAPRKIVLARVSHNPKVTPLTPMKKVEDTPYGVKRSDIYISVRRAFAHDIAKMGLMREAKRRALISPSYRGLRTPVHPAQLRLL